MCLAKLLKFTLFIILIFNKNAYNFSFSKTTDHPSYTDIFTALLFSRKQTFNYSINLYLIPFFVTPRSGHPLHDLGTLNLPIHFLVCPHHILFQGHNSNNIVKMLIRLQIKAEN